MALKVKDINWSRFNDALIDYARHNPNITFKQFLEGFKDMEQWVR
jgi:hypothetical protein